MAPTTKPAAKAGAASTSSSSSSSPSTSLKSAPIFEGIRAAVDASGADLVKKVNGVIQFTVTTGSPAGPTVATYVLDLKKGAGSLKEGAPAAGTKVDLVLTLTDDDLLALGTGELNAQAAFMKGRLKIKGNMGLALKVGTVMEAARKGGMAPKL
jgi:3-hydroxyacyl-CoA dehydrogenase/3a,7a,12a-trihydroxy-5b-cholest-24-enoyl-CoA hydratase